MKSGRVFSQSSKRCAVSIPAHDYDVGGLSKPYFGYYESVGSGEHFPLIAGIGTVSSNDLHDGQCWASGANFMNGWRKMLIYKKLPLIARLHVLTLVRPVRQRVVQRTRLLADLVADSDARFMQSSMRWVCR